VSNEIVKINPTEFGVETTRAAQIESARAKDKEHKRNVNNTAAVDFLAAGLSEKDAIIAVKAIASGKVSNVVIKY
jgi:hypothetical protein